METRYLTVAEVAGALGLSVRTVRAWILRKQINYVKVGPGLRGAVRITAEEVARIVTEGVRRAKRRRRAPEPVLVENPAEALGLVRAELQDILEIGAPEVQP